MPVLNGVIETALYVDDMERASKFYEDVFGLQRIMGDDRLRAYSVANRDVLLLFKRGSTLQPTHIPSGVVPPHDGVGEIHFAFAVASSELPAWEKHFADRGVEIEGRIQWPRGGTSIYFRDPDRNLGELATPGLWSIY